MNKTVSQNERPSIGLVGCAKNEAAYLPEWIFYHLGIGFESIKIYINNTDDNSIDVLDKIIEHYPQVSYVIADDLIQNPPEDFKEKTNINFFDTNKVQAVVYTDALCELKEQEVDHIAFLDIDEFFIPQKPLNQIFSSESAEQFPKRFQWVLLSGDKKEFCTLDQCSKGFIDSSFKSVVPNHNNEIRAEDPHRFSINGDIGKISSDALVLHRVLRSQKEYLYLLSRSTSNQKNQLTNGFKRNRRGWTSRGDDILKYTKSLHSGDYQKKLSAFISLCNISEDLSKAKSRILNQHEVIHDTLKQLQLQNIELTRSLGGSGVSHVNFFKTLASSLFWGLIRALSPRLVLSHETIKEALTFKKNKKHN